MAMTRSLVLLLVVSTTSIPAAFAIRPTATASDSLTKACNGTTFAATCVDVLLKFNPESATASPHRVAEIAYQYLVKDGEALSKEIQSAVTAAAANKKADEGYRSCLDTLNGNVKRYLGSVSRFAPEQGEDKFGEAKNNLKEMLGFPSDSGLSCPKNVFEAEPVVGKTYTYEDMLQVTLDLMNAAAPPPDPEKKTKEEDDAAKEELENQALHKSDEEHVRLFQQIDKDSVIKVCNEMTYDGLASCVAALKSYPEQEVVAATPRRRAELMFRYLLSKGQEVAAEANRAAMESKQGKPKVAACVQGYDDQMRHYMSSITGLAPEKNFDEAKKKVESLGTDSADPSINCTAKDLTDIPVIAKVDSFYDLVMATTDLMNSALKTKPAPSPAKQP